MFSKQFISFVAVAISLLSASEQVLGRERWLERDNKAVFLHPRRFGQENPAVLSQLSSACDGGVCATLAGQAISTLLAGADECAQQDMADQIIDAAQQFDDATKQNMINLAVQFRQAEKNTPPDFTTNPPTNRNSVFCQKAPANAELNGLVQAQDPANDPNIFFDPATKSSVTLGSQPNTFPFGTASSASASAGNATNVTARAVDDATEDDACESSVVTVTVSATNNAAAAETGDCTLVTLTVGADPTATATNAGDAPAATSTAASGIGDFGSCSVPQIEFGTGFDNRKETSFEPVDEASFNHGSAQNIDIITQFICDTLTNSCGADQTAKDTCKTAQAAADAQTPKTGAQADAFNAAFGITTNFASVAAVDDQGNVVAGTGSGTAASSAAGSDDAAASSTAAAVTPAATDSSSSSSSSSTSTGASSGAASGVGDFGSCSVPQIEFGTGFDNRKETSFEPVDKTSFNHGSAQNIDIITQFICDTLTNSCGADQTAKDTCKTAQAAADAQTAKTGAQADAFNAAFGITTNFASVAEVDDQGNVVSGTGSAASGAGNANAGNANNNAASNATPAASSSAAAATATAASNSGNSASGSSAASGGNLQSFTGNLGASAPAVTALGNGQFQVDGNSAFNSLQNALTRSCDVQHNQCANAANASGNQGDLTVDACGQQQDQCNAQAQSASA
ncbi:uncharacterized protein FOMMEDRAFT_17361 [Fomitiporia mediterranea MF3/22]|uniref:uncharacterized protein n=1 Tax=Fomitiporia mediterranea (strain MF3/22) TaxID=694068 RepID=UPI0004408F1D|nr:uncharacterized protein FOMMEDRAFT_17361 [Fomitiporia mediterranea MF3/22]EJD06901.1 hypothetical protein FOMMEDRAFT_17361 [Fomitiporia mediterranea MF3/22]